MIIDIIKLIKAAPIVIAAVGAFLQILESLGINFGNKQ